MNIVNYVSYVKELVVTKKLKVSNEVVKKVNTNLDGITKIVQVFCSYENKSKGKSCFFIKR